MSNSQIFYQDSSVIVTQSKLIIGKNQYDIDKMNFAHLEEQFAGFTLIGWLVAIIGVITLPVYAIGVVILVLAYVYFPRKKYVITIMLHKKKTPILKSGNLEYIKKVKKAVDQAIDISMAQRAMKY